MTGALQLPDPLRVAVVGAGPSGFYAVAELTKATHGLAHIDIIDRLPTPYGLVRAGVAPDHQNIKSVTKLFAKTAEAPNVRFIGGVEVGNDIAHSDLMSYYHVIVYAIGAPISRSLSIPGTDLTGYHTADRFVGWYNGHPDHRELAVDLGTERAVVVGNGNVALDIARILVKSPLDLATTDIADHALDRLARSRIREVVVLGRRGPVDASWTNPELTALGRLTSVDVTVETGSPGGMPLPPPDARATQRLNLETLREFADKAPLGHPRRILLGFNATPVRVVGDTCVTAIQYTRNNHPGDAISPAHSVETLPAGLVISAIGFLGRHVPGVPAHALSGVIDNDAGRVVDPRTGSTVRGVYATGWVKRGPSGVIGMNRACAQETVRQIAADLEAGQVNSPRKQDDPLGLIASTCPGYTSWAGWSRIDDFELGRGRAQGRPRIKITDLDRLHAIARHGESITPRSAAVRTDEREATEPTGD